MMKKLAIFLTVFGIANGATAAALTPFVCYTTDIVGDNVTNTVTIESWPQTNIITGVSTNLVISFQKAYYPTNPAGYFTGALATGNYRLTFAGIARGVVFGIPSSTSTQNLAQLAGIPIYAFQNFTVAQFSDAGTAAYSNANAFLPSWRTNWLVTEVTNAGTAAYSNSTAFLLSYQTNQPASQITNAGTAIYSNATDFLLSYQTNQPLSEITNAGTAGYSNYWAFVRTNGGLSTAQTLDNPAFSNAVNYGNAFRSPGTGTDSDQIGNGAMASGDLSFAAGDDAIASASSTVALGDDASAHYIGGTALGQAATVETNTPNGTAVGGGAMVGTTHTNSTALGTGAATTAKYQVRLGTSAEHISIPGVIRGFTADGTNRFSGSVSISRLSLTTLANGINDDIGIGTNSNVYVSGPSAAFSIRGMSGGEDGRVVFIENDTGFDMTIAVEGGALGNGPTAANRITSNTGADRATTGNGSAILKYNASTSRWKLIFFDP